MADELLEEEEEGWAAGGWEVGIPLGPSPLPTLTCEETEEGEEQRSPGHGGDAAMLDLQSLS